MTELIDISLPLSEDLPVWPGNPRFKLEPVHRMASGAHCNDSSISMNIHTGTHIDAPWHFLPDGSKSESVCLDHMVGKASVVEFPEIEKITAADLESANIGVGVERILLRTENSKHWSKGAGGFRDDFVALTHDGAEWLARRKIKLVGIDYLSIQRFGDSNQTHETLLEAGIIILEGLDLHKAEPGEYELLCLPLSIRGAEGAPARAILRK